MVHLYSIKAQQPLLKINRHKCSSTPIFLTLKTSITYTYACMCLYSRITRLKVQISALSCECSDGLTYPWCKVEMLGSKLDYGTYSTEPAAAGGFPHVDWLQSFAFMYVLYCMVLYDIVWYCLQVPLTRVISS